MSLELLSAFIVFATVMLFTPGPNNVMLMASGVNFGFLRTLPHMLGVSLGFALMVFLVGLGLGSLFQLYPLLYDVLKYASVAYLLYLAWMIATAAPGVSDSGKGRPLTFIEGALFQWINAKGWVVAIGAITTYAALTHFPFNVVVLSILFAFLGTLSAATWALCGSGLSRFLRSPRALRIFNVSMALLLVVSLYPVLAER
jgi:threonine/homoserine/homoserine lactone efflux protein